MISIIAISAVRKKPFTEKMNLKNWKLSKSKKFYKILSGLFILAIGVLVAVFGGQEVFNVYLGVASFVFGICLLVFSCYKFINDKKFDLSPLTIGTVLLWIGITVLFTKFSLASCLFLLFE